MERDRAVGAAFIIDLPLSKSQPKVNLERKSERPPPARGMALVADDEPLLRSVTCERLKRMGYETISAEDGEQGVLLFRKHQNDITLLVLDVVMPVMSGLECLRKIREIEPQVAVVICSGFARDQLVGREQDVENAVFIKKPYGYAQLERAAEDAVAVAGRDRQPISMTPREPI